MKILIRYLIYEYLKIFGLCLTSIMGVYFFYDFIQKIRRFIKYDPSAIELLNYFLLRIPKVIEDITPLAVLISVLLTLGMLSRHNEIIAMRSAGISSARIALPFLIIFFFISTVLFAANLSLVPHSKQRTDYVRYVFIKNRPPDLYFRQNKIWLRVDQNSFMNINYSDYKNLTLFGVNLYKLHEDFSLNEHIEAERIRYENGTWIIYEGTRKRFLKDGEFEIEQLDRSVIPLRWKPEDFNAIVEDTDKMTYRELDNYVNRLVEEGYTAQRYKVDLNNKVAMPFMSIVFGLIAIPLGLTRVLGHGVSRGIGLSLVIAVAYWVVYSLCITLGYGQVLSPFLSAWLPNIIFGLVGVLLMSSLRQ
jgi:lipopolysaccharide export system permease protein